MRSMDAKQLAAKSKEVTRILKGLAHPARLRMLCKLCERSATVQELQEACGLSQAATSLYLAGLRKEGTVRGERAGKNVIYSISDPRIFSLMAAIVTIYCGDVRAVARKS